jgi:predicted ATPase/class 3 adenylate cyclase
VTFLFTDIEGSTKMWERDAATMQAALARHDEILRSAIEANGGYVFKTVGDAFCTAFPTAPDALEAALEAQRRLVEEQWDESSPLRVRMALHMGAAEERDGDYFGPPVNRVARLLSAAHGGQVVLSLPTHEMVRDQLPAGGSLLDLGERRLKDLFRPERVFELAAPGLLSEFPPLRTLESRPNNLSLQPTPLVGREREVGELAERVRSEGVRLLTLTGPGGTGKTRLALQAAADLLEEFEDGVFFVALATITEPELVPSTIAGPLGVKESAEQPLTEVLKGYLREKELLLVLDNFEQVLEGAPLLGELVVACPKLKVLATSRIALRLYGEQEYTVPPLALPDPRVLPPVEVLTQYEAVRLFVERARAVKADFSVTNENAPAVAEICARLDGLPLAIELAGARVRILPPQKMLERLSNRLKLLKGGARDLPTRQQTLRGAIDWSHDLLEEDEKTLFGRLSVFSGGRTLEAMEEICDPQGDLDVLEGVESLLEKSLLRQEEGPEDEPRFVMLETIHEYAREKLEESGKAEGIKRLYAVYFLALAEEAEPELVGPDQVAWMDRLETEHDNMRSALSWALGSGRIETALRLEGALEWFWYVRGHFVEGGRWLEETLSADEGVPGLVRAKALCSAGYLVHMQGDFERARRLLEESLALYRKLGDDEGTARSLHYLGWIDIDDDIERSRRLLEESLEINRRVGSKRELAMVLHSLASMTLETGEQERMKALFEESEALYRESGDIQGLSGSLATQGWAALVEGDTGQARKLLVEGLELSREIGDKGMEFWQQSTLGLVALQEGDTGRARMLLVESLEVFLEMGSRVEVIDSLDDVGAVAVARGEPLRAARLWGAADALREVAGHTLSVAEARMNEPYMSAARSELGETAFRVAWEEGRAMTEEQAIALALENEENDANLKGTEPL